MKNSILADQVRFVSSKKVFNEVFLHTGLFNNEVLVGKSSTLYRRRISQMHFISNNVNKYQRNVMDLPNYKFRQQNCLLCIFSSCRKTCCGSAQQLNKSKSDEGFIYDKSVKDQNTLLKNHFEIMKWYVVSPWKILWIVTHGNNKAQIHTKIVLWTNNIFVKKKIQTQILWGE